MKKIKQLRKSKIFQSELLPCPFCFSPAEELQVKYLEGSKVVRCSNPECPLHSSIVLSKEDWQKREKHPDTIRLDWLCRNASKLGIKPDFEYGEVTEIKYNKLSQEFTDFRKKIDELREI